MAEDLEVKQDVFAELDRLCPPSAILTSNTSSISISEIASGCAHPERVALAHWMLPPHLIPIVEIAPGESTDAATIDGLRELLESIGKWPVHIRKELPGYLMNRLQFALAREALSLIDKGVTTAEEIDQLIKGVLARRIPVLGIMRQADMAGLDVYRQIFTYLGPGPRRRRGAARLPGGSRGRRPHGGARGPGAIHLGTRRVRALRRRAQRCAHRSAAEGPWGLIAVTRLRLLCSLPLAGGPLVKPGVGLRIDPFGESHARPDSRKGGFPPSRE